MEIIEFNNEQAENFKFCSDNWEDIKKLKEDGLFSLKSGKFVVHKNDEGHVALTEIIKPHKWK